MSTAKCTKCGATAQGTTFEEARNKINHAVGLSRGIKCGDSYGMVTEILTNTKTKSAKKEKKTTPEKPKDEKPKDEKPKSAPKTETFDFN